MAAAALQMLQLLWTPSAVLLEAPPRICCAPCFACPDGAIRLAVKDRIAAVLAGMAHLAGKALCAEQLA